MLYLAIAAGKSAMNAIRKAAMGNKVNLCCCFALAKINTNANTGRGRTPLSKRSPNVLSSPVTKSPRENKFEKPTRTITIIAEHRETPKAIKAARALMEGKDS